MSNRYAETFEQRGHPYDQAMQWFPSCRDLEFIRLFDQIDVKGCHTVLDLPSGGGYLERFLPEYSSLDSVDPSSPFRKSELIYPIDLENLSLPENHYDLVVSLAALHHIDNKSGFLTSVSNALRPGGMCCFADVAANSGISHFLDEFAGTHNTTGHKGSYLEIDIPYPGYSSDHQLKLVEHALKPCPWIFNNVHGMVDFCRLLFGLKGVSDHKLQDALSEYVGFTEATSTNGAREVHLLWELLYITFQKTPV